MASACTAGQPSRLTEMHSACVTRASAMRESTPEMSSASSGKSRWQCESTYMPGTHANERRTRVERGALHRVCRPRRGERLAQHLLDRGARGSAGLVLRELDTDALGAVPLHAFGRDPDDLALHGDAVRVVHEREQHEHVLADLVLARGGNEDPAALEEWHVSGVERGLFADVER